MRRHVCQMTLFLMLGAFGCDTQEPGPPKFETYEEAVFWYAEDLRAKNYPKEEVESVMGLLFSYNSWKGWTPPPGFYEAVDGVFDGMRAQVGVDEQIDIYIEEARLHRNKETGKEAEIILEAFAVKPDPRLYEFIYTPIAGNGPRGDFSAAELPICMGLGPVLDQHPDIDPYLFVRRCETAADGDRTKLWEGAAVLFAEMETAQAEYDANIKKMYEFTEFLAVVAPIGGGCIYGDCGNGWTSRNEQVQSKCIGFGKCIFVGWESNTPDGMVNTRCAKGGCPNGWTSKGETGTWVAKCMEDGECLALGWTLEKSKGKERYTFTCLSGNCQTFGYEAVTPDGVKWNCSCGKDGCWIGVGPVCELAE
jgi:hypothetical protein